MRSSVRVLATALASLLLPIAASAQPLAPGEIVMTNNVAIANSENPILRVDPSTGSAQPLSRLDLLRNPWRVATAPDGNVYVAEFDRFVFRIDAGTFTQAALIRDLGSIDDIETAPDGDILVIDDNELLRLDPDTGSTTTESSLSDLGDPLRVAVRSNSESFVYDNSSQMIFRVEGEVQDEVPTPFTICADDIVYDAASGDLFVLECGETAILRVDPDSGRVDEVTRDLFLNRRCCGDPSSLALVAGDLLVTTSQYVVRVDPVLGTQQRDAFGLPGVVLGDITSDGGSGYFVREAARIVHFESSPTGQLAVYAAIEPPFDQNDSSQAVTIAPTGSVILTVGNGTVLEIDPATGEIGFSLRSDAGTGYPGHLDDEPAGHALISASSQILRVLDATGGVEEVAEGNNLDSIRSIFRETAGTILALEGNEIVRVFANGSQGIVSRGQQLSTGDPRDLTVGPGGDIFATDSTRTDLIRVDLSNTDPDTNQSLLPGGNDLAFAQGIAVEDAGTLVVAVQNGSCTGLARVDTSLPSTSCFASGARFESPFGVAVAVPEPGAAALALVALGSLAALGRRASGTASA